jgi:phosphoglycolate phosphatase-like HAD superfamily hydrolase
MPKYRVVFDIDGVLADFTAKMIEIMGPPETIEEYSLEKWWPGRKKEIHDAVCDADTYEYLNVLPGAKKSIQKLDQMGLELIVVTARPQEDPRMVEVTKKWVAHHFFKRFNQVHVVNYKDKPKFIADLKPHIAYDDSPYQIIEGRKLGVRIVAFAQPWNIYHKDLVGTPFARNWTHLRHVLEGKA